MRSKRSSVNLGFTFDLFVCAAILTLSNDIITKGTDAATVYGFLNRYVDMHRRKECVLMKGTLGPAIFFFVFFESSIFLT